jgi:hypothetical protein
LTHFSHLQNIHPFSSSRRIHPPPDEEPEEMNEETIRKVNVFDFDKLVELLWGISDDDDDDDDANEEESDSDSESSTSSDEGDSKQAAVSDGDESGGDMEIDQEQKQCPT